MDREAGGRLVRQAWIAYCRSIGDTKSAHLAAREGLSEADREADRAIFDAVRRYVRGADHCACCAHNQASAQEAAAALERLQERAVRAGEALAGMAAIVHTERDAAIADRRRIRELEAALTGAYAVLAGYADPAAVHDGGAAARAALGITTAGCPLMDERELLVQALYAQWCRDGGGGFPDWVPGDHDNRWQRRFYALADVVGARIARFAVALADLIPAEHYGTDRRFVRWADVSDHAAAALGAPRSAEIGDHAPGDCCSTRAVGDARSG